MELQCPHCRQRYDVDEAYLGRQIQCEWCHNWFVLESDHDSSKDEPQLEPPPAKPIAEKTKKRVLLRACPLCGGEIPANVKKCRHCGGWLDKRDDPCYRLAYLFFALFGGEFGAHNFFAGEKLAGFGHIICSFIAVVVFMIGEEVKRDGGIWPAGIVVFINTLWIILEAIAGREVRIKDVLVAFLKIIVMVILGAVLVYVVRMAK